MNIKNKTVMITGGSSGIGLQMAKTFLNGGANVMICARAGKQLEEVKQENPSVEIFACNLSNTMEVIDLIKKVGDKIDIWVNNAGVFQSGFVAWLPYVPKKALYLLLFTEQLPLISNHF
jgi:uncharacterized oxidoreductase